MKKIVAGLVMLGFGVALALPPEGLYFGSASYGGKGNQTELAPCYTGHAHSRWTGSRPTPSEQIRITKEEGYGNCLQFWQWGGELANLVEEAAKAGIWSLNINLPIGGAQRIADANVNWYPSLPEESWEIPFKAFFPLPDDVLAPNRNFYLAGSPYGLCDLTSFACDKTSADFLLKNYKAVMFAGWNTCSKKQYEILRDYVKGGDIPDDECRYVICSYFPDEGKTYLKNIDFRKPHTFDLKVFGKVTTVTLAPAEMRILPTVRP